MRKIWVLILCLGLIGCATTKPHYFVSVDSINNKQVLAGKKYIILPAEKDVKIDDLQFKEYATYVTHALESKGYTAVDKFDDADIAIFLIYGIGEPKEHAYSYSLPIWGQTGVSSANTFGTATAIGKTATYSGTTTYTPTYGVVGSNTYSGSFVTYTRYIIMDAYDLKLFRETKKERELWKTNIISTGSSGDLRRVFPVLVAASAPYIGENTGQQVHVTLNEDSQEVLKIKGISENK